MPEFQQKRFDNYRTEFDDENTILINSLKENIKLTIMNNTDN